jgi:hypothetical protein
VARNRGVTGRSRTAPRPCTVAVPPERLAASDLGVWGHDGAAWLEFKARCVQSILVWYVGRIESPG